jgi:hypothetical protein
MQYPPLRNTKRAGRRGPPPAEPLPVLDHRRGLRNEPQLGFGETGMMEVRDDEHVGAPEPVDRPSPDLQGEAHSLLEVAELEVSYERIALETPAASDGALHLAVGRETAVIVVLDRHTTGNRPDEAADQRAVPGE